MAGPQAIVAFGGRGAPVKPEVQRENQGFQRQRSNAPIFHRLYDYLGKNYWLFRESLTS